MYSGVGIKTAKGSGTSGYVQRNMSALRPTRNDSRWLKEQTEKAPASRDIDPGIVHHNALREIEVQLVSLRDQLEDEYVYSDLCIPTIHPRGLSEEEIEDRLSSRREELRQSIDPSALISAPLSASTGATVQPDSHTAVLESRLRDERLAEALDIGGKGSEDHRERRSRSRSPRARSVSSSRSGPRDRHGRTYRK
jgi:hypothetical protein